MLKKLLVTLAVIGLVLPSVSYADGRYYNGYRNSGHHHGGYYNDRWVGPLIGGIIIGGILSQRHDPAPVYQYPNRRYEYYQPPVRYYCKDILVTEYDRWGNPYQYYVRKCD